MVLVTLELIKNCSSHTKHRRQESVQEFFKRITHLHLNGKHITKISELDECVNIEVLYLYDNDIKQIENLDTLTKLTNLYLQDNQIAKISNLEKFNLLQKLSLDRGLETAENLEELYISAQRRNPLAPPDQQLTFEEDTLSTLSRSLTSLHCASNNISKLDEIAELKNLTFLDLAQNNITDFEELRKVLSNCTRIRKLILKGNPICRKREYKDNVIAMSSPALLTLDDKEITSNERIFLEKKVSMRKLASTPSSSSASSSPPLTSISAPVTPHRSGGSLSQVPSYSSPGPRRYLRAESAGSYKNTNQILRTEPMFGLQGSTGGT